jgi:hypothetical protein
VASVGFVCGGRQGQDRLGRRLGSGLVGKTKLAWRDGHCLGGEKVRGFFWRGGFFWYSLTSPSSSSLSVRSICTGFACAKIYPEVGEPSSSSSSSSGSRISPSSGKETPDEAEKWAGLHAMVRELRMRKPFISC